MYATDIINKFFHEWSVEMQQLLRACTVGRPDPCAKWTTGESSTALAAINDEDVLVDTFVYISYGKVVGWSMHARHKDCPSAVGEVSIYVDPEYRGLNVSYLLMFFVVIKYGKIIVNAWDERSTKFYNRMKKRFGGKIEIMNYWHEKEIQ